MKNEIEIPDGYGAMIVGNKVVFVPKESEDDRIRREMIEYFHGCIKRNKNTGFRVEQMKGWIAYLESQKEQKPISSCDIVPYIDDKIAALQDMWREEKVSFDWDDMKDMIEDVARHFYHKEQKPAEWSEEDELNKETAIRFLNTFAYGSDLFDENGEIKSNDLRSCVDWLKSLHHPKQEWSKEDKKMLEAIVGDIHCGANFNAEVIREANKREKWLRSLRPQPHWKPSDKQLSALERCVDYLDESDNEDAEAIGSLCHELKNL